MYLWMYLWMYVGCTCVGGCEKPETPTNLENLENLSIVQARAKGDSARDEGFEGLENLDVVKLE
jgi:hypothetical protein